MESKRTLSLPKAEPALVRAVAVVIALLASYGVTWAVDMDTNTQLLIATLLTILAPLVQGLWTRFGVTANAKVVARTTTAGQVVAGDAAVIPTGTELGVDSTDASRPPVLLPVPIKPELATDTLPY